MPRHPLKREIIATHVTNSMLNRVGGTFVHYIMEITGFSPAEIVRAYLLAREASSWRRSGKDRGAQQQGRRQSTGRDGDRGRPFDRARDRVVPPLAAAH